MAEITNSFSLWSKTPIGRTNRRKPIRTPQSCDRCKIRKTKCVNSIPGPCEYCATIGASCVVNLPRKKRPFYHVTEEEYRLSMLILQHHYPGRELTLDTLKTIAENLGREISSNKPGEAVSSHHDYGTPAYEESEEQDTDSEELTVLHNELGCLMRDPFGRYRYIAAYSEIPFNDAVCSIKIASTPSLEGSKLIDPLRKHTYPYVSTEAEQLFPQVELANPHLPPREYCDYYVARFFEEVHCTYWLFPFEQFHTRLDETYRTNSASSCSWLCCMYSIFALGAASSSGRLWNELAGKAKGNVDTKSSLDYLALAKDLITPMCNNEADIDSIRGLAISTLAQQSSGFKLVAWLHLGLCVQIAYSLGLPQDNSSASQSPVGREQNRRIWWTLYLLDQSTASFSGNSFLIDDVQIPLPSDILMDPGPNNPQDCFQQHLLLCRLKGEIIRSVYPNRGADIRTISFSRVTTFNSLLQKWLTSLPSHLKWGISAAPNHRRAISLLHLEYWSSVILLTRPFLFHIVRHGSQLADPKKKWMDSVAEICTDAAQNSLAILKTMSTDETLSSLTVLDSASILKVVMIQILSLWRTGLQKYRHDIDTCLTLLQGMEQIGFCRSVVEELPGHLEELGINESHICLHEEGMGPFPNDDFMAEQLADFEWYFFDTLDDSFLINVEGF